MEYQDLAFSALFAYYYRMLNNRRKKNVSFLL